MQERVQDGDRVDAGPAEQDIDQGGANVPQAAYQQHPRHLQPPALVHCGAPALRLRDFNGGPARRGAI